MGGATPTQKAFINCKEPYPAFIGGYGSGKTAAAIARAMALKIKFPEADIAYYLPSYPLVEDIVMRRFPELCERKGWPFKIRGGTSPHIEFPNAGRIIFRSLSHPESIVGYEVAHSICDELDTLPAEKARLAWNKVIARNRQKIEGWPNSVAVATTPEGFRFVYERWVKNPAQGYVMFKAKTIDNADNLPDGYIDNLRNSYPENLLAAYLDGEFVNLTSGSVYHEFDRKLNGTAEKIRPGEPLHVGLDFNVNNMSAVVGVIRDGNPLILDELTQIRDTPTMARALRERYQGHSITIYPDASGGSHKSVNASLSDISILRSEGFTVLSHSKNPAVRDRVLAVNNLIHNQGARRLKINFDKCPTLVAGLEQQAYDKNGNPDKANGTDHLNDALGYFIVYKFGMARGPVAFAKIVGI
jgi:hypothetical protein